MALRDKGWSFNGRTGIGPKTSAQSQGSKEDTDTKSLIQGSGKDAWFWLGLWWAKRELPVSNQPSKYFPYAVEDSKFIFILFA